MGSYVPSFSPGVSPGFPPGFPSFPPCEVVIWDDRNTRIMAELRFKSAVRSVQRDAPRGSGLSVLSVVFIVTKMDGLGTIWNGWERSWKNPKIQWLRKMDGLGKQ